jgi:broad specificity phosphatase PhoE
VAFPFFADLVHAPLELRTALLCGVVLVVSGGILVLKRMEPKRFYIVRHGRTILNEQHIKQGAEGKLDSAGELQAEHLGVYLKQVRIQRIITSPYERAVQTAQILAAHMRVPIVISPLFAERRNPSEVIGRSTHDPHVIEIVGRIERGYHQDEYRYSDEENFMDLKKRSRACLRYLERVRGTAVAVVTHHALLQVLLSYMLYREDLHTEQYVKLAFFNPAENGGVTICEFHPWKRFSPTHGWEIVAYNESIE